MKFRNPSGGRGKCALEPQRLHVQVSSIARGGETMLRSRGFERERRAATTMAMAERSVGCVKRRSIACFLSGSSASILEEIEAEDGADALERFFPSPVVSRFLSDSDISLSSESQRDGSWSGDLSSPSVHRMSISTSRSEGNDSRCLLSFKAHHGSVVAIAIDEDLLYTGSDDGHICCWRRADAKEMDRFSGACGVKAIVVASKSKTLLTAHQDRRIRAWRRSSASTCHRLVSTLPTVRDFVARSVVPGNYIRVRRHRKCLWHQHFDAISVLAVGAGVVYSGSWDRTIKVWRLSDFRCIESIRAHADAVSSLAFDQASGALFSGSADGTIRVWRPEQLQEDEEGNCGSHELIATLPQRSAVNSISIAGGWLYAGCSDGSISAWAVQEGGSCELLRGHTKAVLCTATAGDVICSGSADRSIRVWRRRDGDSDEGRRHWCVAALQEYHCRGPVKSVALSLDVLGGCLVYGGGMDGWMKVWWAALDAPNK